MQRRSIYESTLEHINSLEKQLDEVYKKEKSEIAEMRRKLASTNGQGGSSLSVAVTSVADNPHEGSTGRPGSKTAKVIQLLKRPNGAAMKDLVSATQWNPNSLRGFLSGTVAKKMGLPLNSKVGADGDRVYWIG
jgi:hypothetical protein